MIKKLFVCFLGICLAFLSFQVKALSGEDSVSENITKFMEGLDRISEMESEEILLRTLLRIVTPVHH